KFGINSRQCHSTQPISSTDNSLCQLAARSPLTSVNSRSVAEFPGQNFPAFVGVNATLLSKLISRKSQTRCIGGVGSATKSSERVTIPEISFRSARSANCAACNQCETQ